MLKAYSHQDVSLYQRFGIHGCSSKHKKQNPCIRCILASYNYHTQGKYAHASCLCMKSCMSSRVSGLISCFNKLFDNLSGLKKVFFFSCWSLQITHSSLSHFFFFQDPGYRICLFGTRYSQSTGKRIRKMTNKTKQKLWPFSCKQPCAFHND